MLKILEYLCVFIIQHWDKIMIIFFAGLSAIFAGFSFLVLWLEYKRNSPNIEVKMNSALMRSDGGLIEYVNCSAVNKGRRPINITGFHFLLKNKQRFFLNPHNTSSFLIKKPEFPQILNEMDIIEFSILLSDLAEGFRDAPSKVKALCFRDTTNKIHKFKIRKKYWNNFFK